MINHPKLNLACGEKTLDSFFNIDKVSLPGVNAVVNLEDFPWPIESGSAERIICEQYIEHTPMDTYSRRLVKAVQESVDFNELKERVSKIDLDAPSDGLILFMEEVHRILKPKGFIELATPYYSSDVCWRDPTHRRAITEVSYQYFNKKWRENSKLTHYGITTDFEVHIRRYDMYGDINFDSNTEKVNAMRYYNNVIFVMHAKLIKL